MKEVWIYSSTDDLFLVIDGVPAYESLAYKDCGEWRLNMSDLIYSKGDYNLSAGEVRELPGEFIK